MSITNISPPVHDHPFYLILVFATLATATLPTPGAPQYPTSPPRPGALVINEIHYDPGNEQTEFIELYNRSAQPIDLRSIRLSDNRYHPAALQGDRFLLAAGRFAVISNDPDAIPPGGPEPLSLSTDRWPPLNNRGDTIVLFAETSVIDSVRYSAAWGRPKISLERIDPAGPSSSPTNWAPSTAPDGATPGARNSVYNPDTRGPQLQLAEQSSDRTITLRFDEPLGTVLQREQITCDTPLSITDIQLRSSRDIVILLLSEPPAARQCTITAASDLTGNRSATQTVSLAYLPAPGDLAITELMYEPVADPFDNRPDQPEYIELYNRSGRALTTNGLFWTDRPSEDGTADTTYIPLSVHVLPTDQYAVIFADPNDTRGSSLRKAFPGPTRPVHLLGLPANSLGLRNDGESIRLHGRDHHQIESLRYAPTWHHPDLVDTRGIALERISVDGPSGEANNWSSSVAPAGGTPGRPNTIAPRPPAPSAPGQLRVTPSPFSPDGDGNDDYAVLSYQLPQPDASVRVRIFDAGGRLIRTLAEARLSAAAGTLVWDGRDDRSRKLPAGIYIVFLEAVDAAGGVVYSYKAPVVIATH